MDWLIVYTCAAAPSPDNGPPPFPATVNRPSMKSVGDVGYFFGAKRYASGVKSAVSKGGDANDPDRVVNGRNCCGTCCTLGLTL